MLGPRAAEKNVPGSRPGTASFFVFWVPFVFPIFGCLSLFLSASLFEGCCEGLAPCSQGTKEGPPLFSTARLFHVVGDPWHRRVNPPTCVPAPSRVSASRSWARPIPLLVGGLRPPPVLSPPFSLFFERRHPTERHEGEEGGMCSIVSPVSSSIHTQQFGMSEPNR